MEYLPEYIEGIPTNKKASRKRQATAPLSIGSQHGLLNIWKPSSEKLLHKKVSPFTPCPKRQESKRNSVM